MKLLVVSQYYYPEQFRINDICKEWVKRGYEVTVLTGIPNYPKGKFYKGYNFLKRRKENIDGIEIIRLPIIPRGKNSIMLLLNYVSFVISGFFFSKFTRRKFDKVFTYEVSPMTQALLGIWYAKRRKIESILYVMDLWPESIELATGKKNDKVFKIIDKMVNYIYKNTDKILTSSESFKQDIIEKGHPSEKIEFWPQYAEEFYNSDNEPVEIENAVNKFKIIFTGNIGYAQGLEILIGTAKILKEKKENIIFYLVGDGRAKEELRKRIKENKLEEVIKLIDKKPAKEIPSYISACDATFISLKSNSISEKILPAKLQSYLASGKPIIGCAKGEIEKIINDSKSGVCCIEENEKKLAEKIIELKNKSKEELEKYGRNARDYYEKNYEKKYLLNKIDSILEESYKMNIY